ncbi:MAG: cytochrome ubiquinol oxidase subunit I, partial [Acidiphilium sp.]|nr:cytochrome ubiquinol oxidase subunit I [Acidiphilium sp.]
PNDIPYVPLIFYAFRIMVGLGFLIWGLGLASLWLRWRGRLYASRRFMWATVVMGPAGFIAMIAGWVVTEAGRQPYTIYGLLRTDQSNSPITLSGMITSLSLILLAYSVLYGIGMLSVLKLLSQPPRPAQAGPDEDVNRQTENKLPDFMRAREAD